MDPPLICPPTPPQCFSFDEDDQFVWYGTTRPYWLDILPGSDQEKNKKNLIFVMTGHTALEILNYVNLMDAISFSMTCKANWIYFMNNKMIGAHFVKKAVYAVAKALVEEQEVNLRLKTMKPPLSSDISYKPPPHVVVEEKNALIRAKINDCILNTSVHKNPTVFERLEVQKFSQTVLIAYLKIKYDTRDEEHIRGWSNCKKEVMKFINFYHFNALPLWYKRITHDIRFYVTSKTVRESMIPIRSLIREVSSPALGVIDARTPKAKPVLCVRQHASVNITVRSHFGNTGPDLRAALKLPVIKEFLLPPKNTSSLSLFNIWHFLDSEWTRSRASDSDSKWDVSLITNPKHDDVYTKLPDGTKVRMPSLRIRYVRVQRASANGERIPDGTDAFNFTRIVVIKEIARKAERKEGDKARCKTIRREQREVVAGRIYGVIRRDGSVLVTSEMVDHPNVPIILQSLNDDLWNQIREMGRSSKTCLLCGAILNDKFSLESGVGPTCRKKWNLKEIEPPKVEKSPEPIEELELGSEGSDVDMLGLEEGTILDEVMRVISGMDEDGKEEEEENKGKDVCTWTCSCKECKELRDELGSKKRKREEELEFNFDQ